MLKSKTKSSDGRAPRTSFFFNANISTGHTCKTSNRSSNSFIKTMNLINYCHQGFLLKTVYQTCRCIGGGASNETSVISNTLFIACGFKEKGY